MTIENQAVNAVEIEMKQLRADADVAKIKEDQLRKELTHFRDAYEKEHGVVEKLSESNANLRTKVWKLEGKVEGLESALTTIMEARR